RRSSEFQHRGVKKMFCIPTALRTRKLFLPSILLAGAVLSTGNPPAFGANIVVNTLADPSVPGSCPLHDAVLAASAAVPGNGCQGGSGDDTITFSVSGTIVLSQTLQIAQQPNAITINGAGQNVILSGNNAVPVIGTVNNNSALNLVNLTI